MKERKRTKIFRILKYLNDIIKIIPLVFFKTSLEKIIEKNNVIIFDTSLNTQNLGDEIIVYYCKKILLANNVKIQDAVSTHIKPRKNDLIKLPKDKMKIITGTNIISTKENRDYLWVKPKLCYLENICLMGCGANQYGKKLNLYSQLFYKKLLSKTFLHSVRDSYTENLLKNLGINNVINTACPTMWNLTPDFCRTIPVHKAPFVVTTITDYSKDIENDFYLLDQLIKNYERVYIWIQGDFDYEYLKQYKHFDCLNIIGHSLNEYVVFLQNTDCDYIGTRLHAGIRALNEKKRTLIVAVDERAIEISKDTGLNVISREEIQQSLEHFILNDYQTKIVLPLDNIQKWKKQFLELED